MAGRNVFDDVLGEFCVGDGDDQDVILDPESGDEVDGGGDDSGEEGEVAGPGVNGGGGDATDFNWIHGDRPKPNIPFTGQFGLQIPVPEEATYKDFFNLFLPENFFSIVTEETNRYARNFFVEKLDTLPRKSRFRKYDGNPITVDEMKRFYAITTAMGLVVQEHLDDYWSVDEVVGTPFFPSVMSRDRFKLILSFLHFADNDAYVPRGQEGHDPLYKLGMIHKEMVSKFNTVFKAGENIALDEGMIPFRGQVHFRVYSPDKPDKYGIKVYMLCDCSSGYCSHIKFYTGASTEKPGSHGKTYDIVMDMLKESNLLQEGRKLYVDNYYSSPQLFSDLYQLKTGATGTARNRRGMPAELKETTLAGKGDQKVVHSDELLAMKILDSKPVTFLSTVHSAQMVTVSRRRRHNKGSGNVQRPEVMDSYNKNMGAVDRYDQMLSYSTFRRATLKWTKKVHFHMFSLVLLNSYTVYLTWSRSRVIS